MNHDSDTEMDILLRRAARRKDSGFATTKPESSSSAQAHLDADELSAYAEGALPERARQRYTAHLADCDACRKIVTEITLASAALTSNVEAEEKPQPVQSVTEARRSWREWLATLFSPPVLRYAAPALALVAFAAIALVIWTANRDNPSFVARNEQPRQETNSNVDTKSANQPPAVSTDTTSTNSANPSAPQTTSANTASAAPGVSSSSEEPGKTTRPAPPSSPSLDGVTTADATQPKPSDEPRNQPTTATERQAEAKQQGQPEQSAASANEVEDRNKEKDADALAAQKQREADDGPTYGAPTTSTGAAGGRANRGTDTGGNSPFGAASAGASSDKRKIEGAKNAPAPAARSRRDSGANDEEGESSTRTVAGKRFRQQNGVWVDTAYNSSRSTTRVKRGSEQYRALAADEPVIETVANAFGGSVIVVVRGRAYYIY